jgi:hypothetical protein
MWTLIDSTARANWQAAETRQGQCESMVAALGSAPRMALLDSSLSELSRVRLAPATVNASSEPRRVQIGAHVAGSHVHTATGTPAFVELRTSDGTVIARATAGTSGATVNFEDTVKALCSPSVGSGGVYIESNAALPADVDYIKAPAAGVSILAAAIGDSNMAHAFGSTHLYGQLGRVGAPLQLLANSGKNGVTTAGLISQADQSYLNGDNPGLEDLPPLGWIFTQSGTNGWRGATSITSTISTEFANWIAKLFTFADHVVLHALPPAGGVTTAKQAGYVTINQFFREQVLADTTGRLHYINPWANLIDGDGNIIPRLWLADEIHPSPAGAYIAARDAQAQLEALFANQGYSRAPLITDPADVYPAQPQWGTNPTGTGTVTVTGSWTGTLPTGWTISDQTGTVAIVAADSGDANQIPWVRITPSTISPADIQLKMTASGRPLTAVDPSTLEQLVELRFNNLLNCNRVRTFMLTQTGRSVSQSAYAQLDPLGANGVIVLRQKYYAQSSADTAGGTPSLIMYFDGDSTTSGGMGSVDVRCWSVRG